MDDAGWHKCQPDGVIEAQQPIVIEAKLRQTDEAYRELKQLYMPVVEAYWGQEPAALVVCNSLQSKVQDWLFMGPDADVDELPAGTVGTWFFRV